MNAATDDRHPVSAFVSTTSAVVLGTNGLVWLFAPDVVLPALIPGFPPAAAWLGQLAAAGWLGVAALNWMNRAALLGGIYARAVVLTNLMLYVVTALTVAKIVAAPSVSRLTWVLLVPAGVMAAVYAFLLRRGPVSRDLSPRQPTRHS